jgi:hypothetical protein
MLLALLALFVSAVNCRGHWIFGSDSNLGAERAATELRILRERIQLYREQHAALPSSLSQLVGLIPDELVEDGHILDLWRRPYQYWLEPSSRDGFVVLPLGADAEDPADDIRSDRLER